LALTFSVVAVALKKKDSAFLRPSNPAWFHEPSSTRPGNRAAAFTPAAAALPDADAAGALSEAGAAELAAGAELAGAPVLQAANAIAAVAAKAAKRFVITKDLLLFPWSV